MPRLWNLIGLLALASTFLVAAPATAAASSVTNTGKVIKADHVTRRHTRETKRETVAWTLPADQCDQLPAGVSAEGTGQRVMHIRTKYRNDGTSRVITKDVVRGTAEDSDGRKYHFDYRNFNIEERPATGSGLPTETHQIDYFVMRGEHGVTALRVSFNWRWTYTTAAFPPEDNLEKLRTRSDPLTCDPI